MRKNLLIVAAVLYSGSMCAQDSTAKNLNEVVVTANKFPQRLSNTGKVLSVITREQIDKSAGKDLAQILTEQTGIITNGAYSNPGKDKTVFLRGAAGKYTLFLLDGVPLNDPSGTGGSYDIRLLPLEQIERIEILKGSQSTLYGANAIAGVINIITKKATSEKLNATALATYGSYNTTKGAVTLSQKIKKVDYSVGYEYLNTDGISEAKDTLGSKNFDKDGFKRHAFNASVGINLTDKIRLAPYYRFSEFKGDFDADVFTDGDNHYDASLVNTGLLGTLQYNSGTVTVNYGHNYNKMSFQSAFPSSFTGSFNTAEAYVHHNISQNVQLLGGVNYQTYHLKGAEKDNNIFSAYTSLYLKSNNGFHLEAGGRFNQHDEAGSRITYSFNPSYLINDNVKFFANFSSGFRPPSISELYGFGANPDLGPETSDNMEAGVQVWALNKKLSFLANWFDRRIENAIVYFYDVTAQRSLYINRDKQHDFGAEAELQYKINDKASLRASYAFVDGEFTQKLNGKDTSFNNLVRRPKHSFNLHADYQFTKRLYASTSLIGVGERTDYYFDPSTFARSEVPLSSYVLWNVYAEYNVLNNLKVFADAKNLTNKKDYYEVYGYSVQGFNINGGIRFNL